jgi:hypothetical protein
MGCKTESINALKRKKEEEDKGRKNKIFLKEKDIYIRDSSQDKGFQN